jgi:hypothetical protein
MEEEEGIRVCVRIRPLSTAEISRQDGSNRIEWRFNDTSIQEDSEISRKTWTYDAVFGPATTNASVYDAVARPVVTKALMGYNGTVFAYGQTGEWQVAREEGRGGGGRWDARGLWARCGCLPFPTLAVRTRFCAVPLHHSKPRPAATVRRAGSGKTYSMLGTPDDPGILPRSIGEVFAHIAREVRRGRVWGWAHPAAMALIRATLSRPRSPAARAPSSWCACHTWRCTTRCAGASGGVWACGSGCVRSARAEWPNARNRPPPHPSAPTP